jgi:hypothetical protein
LWSLIVKVSKKYQIGFTFNRYQYQDISIIKKRICFYCKMISLLLLLVESWYTFVRQFHCLRSKFHLLQAITRLNRMGLTLSVSTKLRLLDEAGAMMDTAIVSKLQTNPLFKVTGDNLDIYIRTGHKSLEKSNTDLHLFASNAIFSRVCNLSLYFSYNRYWF